MPYQGERANKASHVDIVQNPEVIKFLSQCEYLRVPTDAEGANLSKNFVPPPSTLDGAVPENIIAIDGSYYESSIDDKLPSTKVGYIKVSSILIKVKEYRSLTDKGPFVDPFKVAQLQENNAPITFTLPSANIRLPGKTSVRDSFRSILDGAFLDSRTRMREGDAKTSLRSTLFHLASLRPDDMGTNDPARLRLHKCPSCGFSGKPDAPLELVDVESSQKCPECKAELYPTDCLRIWEEVSDHQSNAQAMGRLMMVIEHLMPIHYVRCVAGNSLAALGTLGFFIDGPLAIFGNCAWLYSCIMKYLNRLNADLARVNQPPLLMIGLQKTGQVVDHFSLIQKYIAPNSIFPITDDYRYRYILNDRESAANGFGDETYYGQDFIYKTKTGRSFVLGVPYPFPTKRPIEDFIRKKTDLTQYTSLGRAIQLIDQFESDLYKNAVVPIALAHHYTSISLRPGGRVLDLLTRKGLSVE